MRVPHAPHHRRPGPAGLQKAGPASGLPIAVAFLLRSEQASPPQEASIFLGELSLYGSLGHTNGILPMVALAREQGFAAVYVLTSDVPEATRV